MVPCWIPDASRSFFCYAPCLGREHFRRARFHQGPSCTHSIPHLTLFMSTFPLHPFCFHLFSKMCSPPSVGSMIFEVAPTLFASKMPLFGPSKRRDESFVVHLVRYNRSTARSVRLFSPTVGSLGDSRCGKIRHKNVYFLLTASWDQSFRHFIKNDCFIALTIM